MGPHKGIHICIQLCTGGGVDVGSQVDLHTHIDANIHILTKV